MDDQTPSLDCDEKDIKDDDDSVVSERCWEEMYRGDSRKWLIRDGSRKKSDPPIGSTMKATYPHPHEEDRQYVGIRRTILQQKFYDEAVEEVIRERNKPLPVEEYCTEYDGNYNMPGFEPEKIPERNKELNEKYPLYESKPLTYWQFQFDKHRKGAVPLLGLSAAIDPKNPFRRNSLFTKPLDEILDGTDAL